MGVNDKLGTQHFQERKSHRAYRDPTADAAIANVMREERMKKKSEHKMAIAFRKRYGTGGNRYAAK